MVSVSNDLLHESSKMANAKWEDWSESFIIKFSAEFVKYKDLHKDDGPKTGLISPKVRRCLKEMARALDMKPLARRLLRYCTHFRHICFFKLCELSSRAQQELGDSRRALDLAPQWLLEAEAVLHYLTNIELAEALLELAKRGAGKGSAAHWAQLMEPLAARLASGALARRMGARPLLPPRLPSRGIHVRLGYVPAHSLWERVKALASDKLRVLLEAGDEPRAVREAARMAPADWLVVDALLLHAALPLLHEESYTLYEQLQPLVQMFQLAQQFGLEDAAHPEPAVLRWTRAHACYCAKGLEASVVLLQRRWWELKKGTRAALLAAWRSRPGPRPRVYPIHVAVARRFPHVVTAPQRSWAALVHDDLLVLEPSPLQGAAAQEFPRDAAPVPNYVETDDDLVLIEPHIDTVYVEDEEYRDSDFEDEDAKLVIDEPPSDRGSKEDPENRNSARDDTSSLAGASSDRGEVKVKYEEIGDDCNSERSAECGMQKGAEVPGNIDTTSEEIGPTEHSNADPADLENASCVAPSGSLTFECDDERNAALFEGYGDWLGGAMLQELEKRIDREIDDFGVEEEHWDLAKRLRTMDPDLVQTEIIFDTDSDEELVGRSRSSPEPGPSGLRSCELSDSTADADAGCTLKFAHEAARGSSSEDKRPPRRSRRASRKASMRDKITFERDSAGEKSNDGISEADASCNVGAAGRVTKRVSLPHIDEVRRSLRGMPTAQVPPLAKPPQSAPERVARGRNSVPEESELKTLLEDLSAEWADHRAEGAGARVRAFCCLARRHRVVNDARLRVAARAPRNRMPSFVDIHDARHEPKCECCCLHLLRVYERDDELLRQQRGLRRYVADLAAAAAFQVACSAPPSPPARPASPPPAADRKRPKKKKRKDDTPEESADEAELAEYAEDYREWIRQKNIAAKLFGLGPPKKRPAAPAPAPTPTPAPAPMPTLAETRHLQTVDHDYAALPDKVGSEAEWQRGAKGRVLPPSVGVRELLLGRDPATLQLLCVARKALRPRVVSQLFFSALPHPVRDPVYCTLARWKGLQRVQLEEASSSSSALSVAPSIVLDDKYYMKLCEEPLVYAQVYFMVSEPGEAFGLVLRGRPMAAYLPLSGRLFPIHKSALRSNSASLLREQAPAAQLNQLIQWKRQLEHLTPAEVIAVDSDDE